MVTIQQGPREDGFEVSMVKLCRWFGVARRSVYYRPTKASPTVKSELAVPSSRRGCGQVNPTPFLATSTPAPRDRRG